jgi:hypothetical protein
VEMPEHFVREMIADWIGASRAYEGKWPKDNWPWLAKNFSKVRVHPNTRLLLLKILSRKFPAIVVAHLMLNSDQPSDQPN